MNLNRLRGQKPSHRTFQLVVTAGVCSSYIAEAIGLVPVATSAMLAATLIWIWEQ